MGRRMRRFDDPRLFPRDEEGGRRDDANAKGSFCMLTAEGSRDSPMHFAADFFFILDWRLWRPSPLADSRSWSWFLTAGERKNIPSKAAGAIERPAIAELQGAG